MITQKQLKDATNYELGVLAEALGIEREGASDDELRELILKKQKEMTKQPNPTAKKRGRPSKKAVTEQVEEIKTAEIESEKDLNDEFTQ